LVIGVSFLDGAIEKTDADPSGRRCRPILPRRRRLAQCAGESYAMFGCARLRAALETMADFDIAKE
jgi:hypothetical protein